MRKTWKQLLLVFLVLLWVSSPLYSEVCLTDEEWAELDMIWTELEALTEEQAQELELAETLLVGAEREILKSEACLKEVELSLIEQEKEQRRKTIIWAMGSFLVGSIFGLVAGATINR